MRAPSRAFLFALLTACTPAAPPAVDTPTPAPPPPTPLTTITIHADAPGRNALVVEHDITVPLEQALAGIPGLAELRSVSRTDAATLVLTLAPGTAADPTRSAVYEQLTTARASLPADINPPTINPELAPHTHAVHFIVTGDRPATDLHTIARQLQSELASTPGVATIELCGGREPRVSIIIDPIKLAAYAVSLDAIATTLRTSLSDTPLAPGLQARITARSPEDLADIVVKPGAAPVKLADLARVSLDASVPACDAAPLAGGSVVIGTVLPRRTTDPGEFNSAVQARLAALRNTLPTGLESRVAILETSTLELLATNAAETLPLAARNLANALPGRTGYVQAHTGVAPGVAIDVELLLAPIETTKQSDLVPLATTLAAVPGLKLRAQGPESLTRVLVQGDDLETAARIASELATLARKLPGIASAEPRWALDPELALDLDRDRLARLGVAEPELRTVLAAAIAGLEVGKISNNGETLPVHLQLGEPATDPMARVPTLGALQLPTPSGSVPLSELVTFRATTQPHAIVRVDRRRAVEVELQLTDPAALPTLQKTMAADLRLPPGYFVRFD
jgi:multidrug efflux pump subunit AcrB